MIMGKSIHHKGVKFPSTSISEKANGEVCTSAMQCMVTDSVCNAGICGCPADMYLQGMACMNSKYFRHHYVYLRVEIQIFGFHWMTRNIR